MLAYKFRLYPSKIQEKQMLHHLILAKDLWNELLAHSKRMHQNFGLFPNKTTLITMAKKYGLFSQSQQEIAGRICKSIRKFLKLKKQRKEGGFPRFKSIDRMKSLNYPQAGFKLKEKKLYANPFGKINIKQHREIKGKIKTLTLKRMPTGKWFACFVVEELPIQPKQNAGEKIGIDLGLKNFVTLSNGVKIENPCHLKKYEERLAFLQRRKDRKQKKSHNQKKDNLRISKMHEKIADTRTDFLHKLSTKLVNDFSLIALEKLAIQQMTEQNFGKQINDAGWGTFAKMLAYKAEGAGCQMVFVNPKNTTKQCSQCGAMIEKTLGDRIHKCFCGLEIDRDENASINILAKATVGITGINASGIGTIVPTMKEETT